MRKRLRLSKLSLFLLDLIGLVLAVTLVRLPQVSYASPMENADNSPRSLSRGEVSFQDEVSKSPVPTAVLAFEPPKVIQAPESLNLSPNPASQPLRFTFPTPQAAPVSALRPALYPVPWALTPYDHFYFSRPVAADEINWPLADYRYGGVFFEDIVHSGVDIPTPMRTPILAAGPGKVTWAGYGLYNGYFDTSDPYGLAVLVRHEFGFQGEKLYTVYAHLDRIDVTKGETLEIGDQIGLSGQTGMVTGPHLHFEVRLAKGEFFSTRNPELWLVPPQGWGLVAGRVMNNAGVNLESHLVVVKSVDDGQIWKAFTYGRGLVKSDPYYQENMVISDLPAGRYEIHINFWGRDITQEIEIRPGLVRYFTFRGLNGFSLDPPPAPGANFIP